MANYDPPPIDASYGVIKQLMDVGGYDNLPEEHLYNLIMLVPCYTMSLRESVLKAFHEFKEAKAEYQRVFARAFLASTGSVDVRKMTATLDPDVEKAEAIMSQKEAEYEHIKNLPNDWLELQQAMKRLCDARVRKVG